MQIKGNYDKNDGRYKLTVDSGVTLLIPYENGKRNPETGEAELTTLTAPTTTNLVTLKSGVILNISKNAILEIGGQRYAGGANTEAGSTAGNTAVLELGSGASIICSGSINLFGFIDEDEKDNSSSVTINYGASITMPFVIYDFRGGSASSAIYFFGKESASVFNRFAFVNVVPTLIINYGGDLYGVANLHGDNKVNYATGHIVGDDNTSVLQLTDGTYSKLIAKLDEARKVSHIQIIGGAKTNGLQLTLIGQDVDTADYVFGIGYNFDITLMKDKEQNSATFEMGQLYKLLPGAKLTVDKGATLNLSGKMNIYSEGWVDKWDYGKFISKETDYTSYTTKNAWTGETLGPAMLIVKGTLDANVLGADQIYVYPGASVTIKTTTWTTKDIKEARGTVANSTFTSVTKTLEKLIVYNSDGYAVTLDSGVADFDLSTAYVANTGVSIKLINIKNGDGDDCAWYTASSGGTKVDDAGASYTPTGDITLYPQWAKYTVIYNANGGSVNPSSTAVTPGGSVTLPTPSRSGYSFNGWYTAASGGTKIGNAGASYTPTSNITLYAQWKSNTCITYDTLVTLADGSQKRIDEVTYDDLILVWNFYTGSYDVTNPAALVNHGYNYCEIVELTFNDGSALKFVSVHGAFSKDHNQFIDISADNCYDYIGTTFLKSTENGFVEITLVDCDVYTEYTESWTIVTEKHYNAILNGIFTANPSVCAAFPDADVPQLEPYEAFELSENMQYDFAKMQADIEKYGLYTYEEFKDYISYEKFVAWDIATLKVVVGKGYGTYEGVINYINIINQFTPA